MNPARRFAGNGEPPQAREDGSAHSNQEAPKGKPLERKHPMNTKKRSTDPNQYELDLGVDPRT